MPAAAAPSHSPSFRLRRALNWFTLGLTYATFYMGRYNINVIKGTAEKTLHISQAQFGLVGLAGFWTYAASELVNGPLADRIGGKKAILIGAAGAALFNFALGMLFLGSFGAKILVGMSLLYALNMYCQSFGALSVVKVNAPWFHVRERGVFGGVFGIMISLGYTLAFSTAGFVMKHFSWWWVFFFPAAAMATMLVLSSLLVRDRPSEAGFADIVTDDASEGDETPPTFGYIARHVFANPILLTIMGAEFCTGFVRQGLLFFFPEWLKAAHGVAPSDALFRDWVGPAITAGGIAGGLIAGFASDRFFQSRRPPVAFFFYLLQIASVLLLARVHPAWGAVAGIGFCCIWIFGVHGMLSGTASMDFGGKKGAASAAGMLDGIQYVASGITSVGIGWLIDRHGWGAWGWSLVPFSLVGALLMLRLWNATPLARAHPERAARAA